MPEWEVTFDHCVCEQIIEAETPREAIDYAIEKMRSCCDAVLVEGELEEEASHA